MFISDEQDRISIDLEAGTGEVFAHGRCRVHRIVATDGQFVMYGRRVRPSGHLGRVRLLRGAWSSPEGFDFPPRVFHAVHVALRRSAGLEVTGV